MYSVVIPTYKNYNQLHQLIVDIAHLTKRYKPEHIIIVNDAYDDRIAYADRLLESELLPPIRVINLHQHSGPLLAFEAGLNAVDTRYAIMMHSDVRLTVPEPITKRWFDAVETKTITSGRGRRTQKQKEYINYQVKLISDDVLSVLMHKLVNMDDAFAVSCYGLGIDYTNGIQCGDRALDASGTPWSYLVNASGRGMYFDRLWYYANYAKSHFNSTIYSWKRVHSVDTHIVALDMQCYGAFGFNHDYIPYLYFFDDFCGMLRLAGKHLYVTMDTVVYHPEPHLKNKPEGSKSVPSKEQRETAVKLFKSRWKGNPIWSSQSLYPDQNGTEWSAQR